MKKDFEPRLNKIELELIRFHKKIDLLALENDKKGGLSRRLAASVDTIAGLKEAAESKHPILTCFWIVLLSAGIGATTFYLFETISEYLQYPTKTNVKLIRQDSYEYPPMVFCPQVWLDADKVSSLGLSLDAFRYSLGYFDYFHEFEIQDIEQARQEFFKVYNALNFSSLIEYYKSIAVDIKVAMSPQEFREVEKPEFYCLNCNADTTLEKVFMNEGVCYKFNFPSTRIGLGNHMQVAIFKTPAKKFIYASAATILYFLQDKYFEPTVTPGVALQPFDIVCIVVTPKKISTLHTPENPCVTNERLQEFSTPYSTLRCMAECENMAYKEKYDCIRWITASKSQNLSEFCHFYENVGNSLFIDEWFNYRKEASNFCPEICPNKCERTVYDAHLAYQYEQKSSHFRNFVNSTMSQNMSLYYAKIVHVGVVHDGIMTYNETYTYSWIMLTNNIGGTLGLFVGSTLMTVVQVFVFVCRIFVEKLQEN